MISKPQKALSPLALSAISVCVICSILSISQYRYGLDDHGWVIPFLKDFMNPDLYPGDPLLEVRHHFYTLLWPTIGTLLQWIPIKLPTLFFSLYVLSLTLTFTGVYLIAFTLFKRMDVGVLAIFFLLFSKKAFAGVGIIENMFLNRMAILPFLLFAIYLFLEKKYVRSFILQGIAFSMHAVMTSYLILPCTIALILKKKEISLKRIAICLGTLFVLISPILFWWATNNSGEVGILNVSSEWYRLLDIRSAHDFYTFSWSWSTWLRAFLFIGLFILSLKHKPDSGTHSLVWILFVTTLIVCVLHVLFIDIFPTPMFFVLKPFRCFSIFMILTMIYFAHYWIRSFESSEDIKSKLLLIVLAIGIFFDARPFWQFYCGIFVLWAITLMFSPIKWLSKPIPILLVMLIASSSAMYAARIHMGKGHFSINNAENKEWVDIQKWAFDQTNLHTGFIVPPSLMGFRIESERSQYGDWKDGTLMLFKPSFGSEWIKRMQKLGYAQTNITGSRGRDSFVEKFKQLNDADFLEMAKEMQQEKNAVYIITFQDSRKLNFEIAYQNKKFIVYRAL